MVSFGYGLGRGLSRFIRFCCVKTVVLHPERAERTGGYVLACTHLSHLEPVVVTTVVSRQIDWMARIEFYKYHLVAWSLNAVDAFPVNRAGVPVSSIREAVRRAREGRVVGIFPEGGVARGEASIMRGGPFKKGVCVVSYRAGSPVVPVVVMGTEELTRVSPWLPFRRGRVWMIIGRAVNPPLHEARRRVAREMMARELQAEFQAIYRELRETCGMGWEVEVTIPKLEFANP
jgi:1-acyl-sn-glycerol-3-phosphate acyltransferase